MAKSRVIDGYGLFSSEMRGFEWGEKRRKENSYNEPRGTEEETSFFW
jgi:hypothetical protein